MIGLWSGFTGHNTFLSYHFKLRIVEIGGVFERDYTEELIVLEVATASALYPSLYGVRWRIF